MKWLGRDLGQRVWEMMDDRLWNVGAQVSRLQRECDDAEWNDDPRLAYLARELEYFKELDKAGVVYEPKF